MVILPLLYEQYIKAQTKKTLINNRDPQSKNLTHNNNNN